MPPQNNFPPSPQTQIPTDSKIKDLFPPKIFIILILLAGILGSYQVFYSTKAEKVENLEAVAMDTSEWDTYQNNEYGFEVNYPKSWYFEAYYNEDFHVFPKVLIEFDKFPIAHDRESSLTIRAIQQNLEEAILVFHGGMYESVPFERKEVIIGGRKLQKLIYNDGKYSFWFQNNDLAYSIYGSGSNELKEAFISTLKLIPVSTTDTSAWKTYVNTKYNFELKYPKEFIVYAGLFKGEEPVVANENSNDIWVAQNTGLIGNGEVSQLGIEIIENRLETPLEWITKNKGRFSDDKEIRAIRNIKMFDEDVTLLQGECNMGSVCKVYVLRISPQYLMVINSDDTKVLKDILSTIKFIN